ncbi:16S rRNA (adenine(1518)-N(6)/adenine(1519)-N(6))-dimethyltransferase RsmA [Desulfurispira natronophila]|uniref:Ribosomal RNA small subunit methyltransferase A n=1 Tax=Desulfurispira natronophila TaxID=682562 RepID=A0A7W7Y5Q8_9BACT|nr:16S rRNA (adenine(1518)-N(6)/adenine(1519)-N(6))-dimethyltransferase RsmA [Desulfurispira natronophila]MBB5022477.1 16S rRNA (adenine1518-N6/adenine1519-N6)-dimethyltransferase [Desulfurispira natronophila]
MKVKQTLSQHGLRARKSLGQNFLRDDSFVRRIVDISGIGPEDTVVEIGPGLGIMTAQLARRARSVTALEIDSQLLEYLCLEYGHLDNLKFVHGDALEYDWKEFGNSFSLVANLPYNISSQVLVRIVEHREQVTSFTVMLQKEMAQRALAKEGSKDFGPLALYLSLYFDLQLGLATIPPHLFHPAPAVSSAVLCGTLLPQPRYDIKSFPKFQALVRLAFAHRRKTIRNNFRGAPWFERFLQQAPQLGILPERRAESLSLREFYALYNLVEES